MAFHGLVLKNSERCTPDTSQPQAITMCEPCIASGLGKTGVVKGLHPPWHAPCNTGDQRVTGLRVRNTLTGEKELFVPREGNRVTWYTCGPTVYDACHMGHARAYLTMDIMRRILEDYFQYEVFLQVCETCPNEACACTRGE